MISMVYRVNLRVSGIVIIIENIQFENISRYFRHFSLATPPSHRSAEIKAATLLHMEPRQFRYFTSFSRTAFQARFGRRLSALFMQKV